MSCRKSNSITRSPSILWIALVCLALTSSHAQEVQSEKKRQDELSQKNQPYLRPNVRRRASFFRSDVEHLEPPPSSESFIQMSEEGGDAPLVMHTFFHRIDPDEYHKYGGMTDASDTKLLLTWESSWKAAGFETKIITLEDAKHHPAYEKFDKLLNLEKMPFGYYDKLCFLRWLAMAAVGGGYMSDYDTFPLRSFSSDHMKMRHLPNEGRLTVYDTVRNGGVPSVVSGTAEEFDRIAHSLLYNNLQVGIREKFWSDMFALMDIYQKNPEEYVLEDQVLKGNAALNGMHTHMVRGTESTIRECRMVVGGNFAVHFSHFAITDSVEKGLLPHGKSAADRPEIAEDFLRDWTKACPDLLKEQYVIAV